MRKKTRSLFAFALAAEMILCVPLNSLAAIHIDISENI